MVNVSGVAPVSSRDRKVIGSVLATMENVLVGGNDLIGRVPLIPPTGMDPGGMPFHDSFEDRYQRLGIMENLSFMLYGHVVVCLPTGYMVV